MAAVGERTDAPHLAKDAQGFVPFDHWAGSQRRAAIVVDLHKRCQVGQRELVESRPGDGHGISVVDRAVGQHLVALEAAAGGSTHRPNVDLAWRLHLAVARRIEVATLEPVHRAGQHCDPAVLGEVGSRLGQQDGLIVGPTEVLAGLHVGWILNPLEVEPGGGLGENQTFRRSDVGRNR